MSQAEEIKIKEYDYSYKNYLHSDKWYKIRDKVFNRDNNKCTICGATENLVAHHKNYDNLGNEKLEDLITVCEECHEVIHSERGWNESKNKVTKKEIDEIIKTDNLDELKLYQFCRILDIVNCNGQVRTLGYKLNDKIEDKMIQQGIVCSYVMKCIKLAHPFTHILKKSERVKIKTWTELWEVISCSNRTIQSKVKKFLEDNKLVKTVSMKNNDRKTVKVFVLNPYLYKNSSHVGQFACITWFESAIPNVNINKYGYYWLKSLQENLQIEK